MATVLRGAGRASTAVDDSTRPATFTFSDMASQGDRYVASVRAEATKAVQQANADAAAIRSKAEADGRAAADEALERLLEEKIGGELATLRPALERVVAEVEASRGEWLEHWRTAAVRVAVAMAERIVRRELAADPTVSEEWLTEALRLAAGSSDVTVRLSPSDHDHLRGHAESVAATLGQLGEARVVADETISPGGCRIDTRHGAIDQQLETQLARLTEELG